MFIPAIHSQMSAPLITGGNLRTVGELLVGQTCHITDIDVEEHKLVVSNLRGALVHVFELISDSSTE